MRMLALATVALAALSSGASAQDDPTTPPPAATVQTTHVHTRTVTHNDGKKHPQIRRVVHRTTVATPNGTTTRTTTATTRTSPR